MQFTIATVLFAAVAVYAQAPAGAPTGPPAGAPLGPPAGAPVGGPTGNTAQACGNGQHVSCCNVGSENIPVLGGNCEIPILGQSCIANQAYCCNADQNGLVNVGSLCLPITL